MLKCLFYAYLLMLSLFAVGVAADKPSKTSSDSTTVVNSSYWYSLKLDLENKLTAINTRLSVLERIGNNADEKESIKNVLTISANTVKFVGTISTILLPFILLLIGYQVFRSFLFEREIRETRNSMLNEYDKLIVIRSDSEKIINEVKQKIVNLEEFVASLATNVLQKKSDELFSAVRERTNIAISEIVTKSLGERREKDDELIRKFEKLDLTLTPSLYFERGSLYLSQDLYQKSLDNFTEAIRLSPSTPDYYFKRAASLYYLNRHLEAIQDYRKSIDLNYGKADCYLNLGACYRALGDYDNSLACLQESINLAAKSEAPLISRSQTYLKLKQHDLAVADLNRALELNPTSVKAMLVLGIVYGAKMDFKTALEFYIKAYKLNPEIQQTTCLAEAYICANDFKNALLFAAEAYQKAKTPREQIFAKYLQLIGIIASTEDYKGELHSFLKLFQETTDFAVKSWSFDEIRYWLTQNSIGKTKNDLINQIISLLNKAIEPCDFNLQ
jgi:tetratricopeptide (TPR) repeat protein